MGTKTSIENKTAQFFKMCNKKTVLVFIVVTQQFFCTVFKSLESGLREGLNLIPMRQPKIRRNLSKEETNTFQALDNFASGKS